MSSPTEQTRLLSPPDQSFPLESGSPQYSRPKNPRPYDAPPRPLPPQPEVYIAPTWQHQLRTINQFTDQMDPVLKSTKYDCGRQFCGAICCGVCLLPCATARLCSYCCCGADHVCRAPGLEYCSDPRCVCPPETQGYEHGSYVLPQTDGSGCSRRSLDIMNLIIGTIMCLLFIALGFTAYENRDNWIE